MTHSVQYEKAILDYQITGTGPKSLLAFHGFGQGKEVFEELSQGILNDYTIYSFDLFFHGKSEWNYGDEPLEKKIWNQLIQKFLNEKNIQTFDLVGYSMGGKFALATLERFSNQIKNIFLLAPDGLWISPWYILATHPLLMRSFFKSMILQPGRFQRIANFALKLGLIDKSLHRFTESQMNTEEKRMQVYRSWIVFRRLKFDMKRISELLSSNQIDTMVILGAHDKIFPAKKIKRLSTKMRALRVEVVESGHNNLIRKSVPLIHAKMKSDTEGDR